MTNTRPATSDEVAESATRMMQKHAKALERLADQPTSPAPPLDLIARLRDYHDQVLKGFRHMSRVEEADLIQAAIDGLTKTTKP